MSEDNLTVEQLTKSVERLADAVESHFESGDTKTAILARIAQNQANTMNAIERRFDSIERDIRDIKEDASEAKGKAKELDGKLHISNGGDAYITRLRRVEEDLSTRSKWKDRVLAAALTVVVAFAVTLGLKKLWPDSPPQKTLAEQLDDEATRKKLKEILAPPQTATEPKPEPKPEKPRNSTRRRPVPPMGPGAKGEPVLANDREDRIASGRIPMFTLSDGKVSESRRLARP